MAFTKDELREELAAVAIDLAGHIERARVSIIAADTQNTENAATVVRAEAGDIRAQVLSGLEEVLREIDLPAGVDTAALVADVASRLTVTPKTD